MSTDQEKGLVAALILLIIISVGIIYLQWNRTSTRSQQEAPQDIADSVDSEDNDHDEILHIASTPYPPYYDEALLNGGFIAEIVRTAFQRAGYTTDVVFLPWERTLEAAKRGEYDAVFTMWYTDKRNQDFMFSDPLPANELVFFGRADDDIEFDSYSDLEAYTIGTIAGYAYPEDFFAAELRTQPVETHVQNFKKLLSGRIDLVIADNGTGRYTLETEFSDTDSDSIVQVGEPLEVIPQYVVVPRVNDGGDDVLNAFNQAYKEMKEDGTFNTILLRHGFLDVYGTSVENEE